MNEIFGHLQYFGVIYGLLLGLLAVATYQNHTDVEEGRRGRGHRWLRSTATSVPIPSRSHRPTMELRHALNHRGCLAVAAKGDRSVEGQPRRARIHEARPIRTCQARKRCTTRRCGSSMNSSRIAGFAVFGQRLRRYPGDHVVHGRGRRAG